MKEISLEKALRYDPIPRKYLRALRGPSGTLVARAGMALTPTNLRRDFANGVRIAIWHNAVSKAEMYTFNGAAVRWSARWPAIGEKLITERTWRDDLSLADTVLALHDKLHKLAGEDKVFTQIRELALFCHGQTTSILYGKTHIQVSHLNGIVRRIAGALTSDVRIVLYACNTGRSPNQVADWQETTLNDGGETSFAGEMRDQLVAVGKPDCETWAHTTRGHTAYNSALRVFRGRDGTGSPGRSFARLFVHDWRAHFEPRARQAIAAAGFKVLSGDEPKFRAAAESVYSKRFYAVYAATCRNKQMLVDGQRLAMTAPMNPAACGQVIGQRWEQYWQTHRVDVGQEIAKKAGLRV